VLCYQKEISILTVSACVQHTEKLNTPPNHLRRIYSCFQCYNISIKKALQTIGSVVQGIHMTTCLIFYQAFLPIASTIVLYNPKTNNSTLSTPEVPKVWGTAPGEGDVLLI
jgi:hypothetical protein